MAIVTSLFFFFAGAKIHKTAGITRVIEKSGKSYTLKEENESVLKNEMQIYMDHANEVIILLQTLHTCTQCPAQNLYTFSQRFLALYSSLCCCW